MNERMNERKDEILFINMQLVKVHHDFITHFKVFNQRK